MRRSAFSQSRLPRPLLAQLPCASVEGALLPPVDHCFVNLHSASPLTGTFACPPAKPTRHLQVNGRHPLIDGFPADSERLSDFFFPRLRCGSRRSALRESRENAGSECATGRWGNPLPPEPSRLRRNVRTFSPDRRRQRQRRTQCSAERVLRVRAKWAPLLAHLRARWMKPRSSDATMQLSWSPLGHPPQYCIQPKSRGGEASRAGAEIA